MDLGFILIGIAVGVVVFLLLDYFVKRIFSRVLDSEQLLLLRLLAALFSLSLIFAIVSPVAQIHHLFYLLLVILVFSLGSFILGTRRILEQYLTGLFVARVLDLHVGDYIELGDLRGYITALEDAYLVVRDPRREYVYIPYTVLLQNPFRRIKSPEGHEVRIRLFVPSGQDVKRIRSLIEEVAREFGVERLSVDVEKIGARGVTLVVRGVLRDPRQEDELKYAVLDKVYASMMGGATL